MIPQTETVLKSYFVDGATPTEAQFAELIGTLEYLYNESLSAANNAVATANAAKTIAPHCYARVRYSSGVWIIDRQVGCTAAVNTGTKQVTLTFSTALADTVYPYLATESGNSITAYTQNVGSLVATLNHATGGTVQIVVFK